MLQLFSGNHVLLLFALLAVGMALARLSWRGVSLGAAWVLFVALGVSAVWPELQLPPIVGSFGLILFAYTIGITTGPAFVSGLRRHWRASMVVLIGLVVAVAVTALLGHLWGLSRATMAGLFAGATTNTPALAAAAQRTTEPGAATVGYAIAYAGGVLVMLAAGGFALRRARSEGLLSGAEHSLENTTITVEHDCLDNVGDLETSTPHGGVLVSRIERAGTVRVADNSMRIEQGDRVLAVGSPAALENLTERLGRRSVRALHLERTEVHYRRVMLSNPALEHRTVASLDLEARCGATVTRVRRLDQDFLATPATVLHRGDRLRIAAPHQRMPEVIAHLGDSEHVTSEMNVMGLSLGIVVALLLGMVSVPVPGLGHVELGGAAAAVIVGMILGWRGRLGPLVWSLPHSAAHMLTQLGLLLFLAQAGGKAGSALTSALGSPLVWQVAVLGVVVTFLYAVALMALWRRGHHGDWVTIAGMVAGAQTQPAVLAMVNDRSHNDPRITLGYAMVYPAAMIGKILMAQMFVL